ncbi:hypothetical protein GGF47_004401 [Coemansia sp. RSA 2524]|nr:hypothetical protein GGF47_004401 [Coemansia sp. RSA 2524]
MRSETQSVSSTASSTSSVASFQAVWRLHCKHCHVMWSSRGMEAIVMAHPAIRCFSTDLPPLGCAVVHQPVAPPVADMLIDAGCHSCSSLTHHARRFDLAPAGPCDCHVQDIACLGCGNLVGYYIHRPCFRCLAQRLRIKQRGFQHLWTFYQDNVLAVQRESDTGEPVGWEELPSPPPPVSASIRPASIAQVLQSDPTPLRASTQTMVSEQSGLSTLRRNDPAHSALRRDEVLEPLRPQKPRLRTVAPPAGLSNWLFQTGLDCMLKWEEGTLSR